MKQSKESIEEYKKTLEEYYRTKVEHKKDKELEPFLREDVITAIIMCIGLNKQILISELGKVLLQMVTHNYWDLNVSLKEIQSKIMESPFDKKEQLTPQKTRQDFAKEKIVKAMEICHETLPEDWDLIYKLAMLLFKVDYLDYNYIKKGLAIIQGKYLTRLHRKKLAYAVKTNC